MFLTIKVELLNNYAFLEKCCDEYTYNLAMTLEDYLEGRKSRISHLLPEKTKEEIKKKAYSNYQKIINNFAIDSNYLEQTCIWRGNDFHLVPKKRSVSLKYDEKYQNVNYKLNIYQDRLLDKMIIYRFWVKEVQDYWIGYFLGVCSTEDYYEIKKMRE